MLQCDQVTMDFGPFRAVDECSFSVEQGSITGLIGPNGAGKSTMFNMIAGAFRNTSGRILYEGEDITDLTTDKRFHKGLVRTFQIPHEFQNLTVLENLMVVPPKQTGESLFSNWLSPRKVADVERQTYERAVEALEFLELTHVTNERAGRLSGGQKKLLELGRTIMTDAKLVLLDEPAAGVNRTLLHKLEEKIQFLNKERDYTFVLIEHDMEMIEKLCGHIICMAEGKVLIQGDFRTVRSDARVLDAYLGERQEVLH